MSFLIKVVQFPELSNSVDMAQFECEIKSTIESGYSVILLDLENIKIMTSAGLMVLVSTLKTVRSHDRKLFLCSIQDQVRMLLELTGLDQVIESFDNLNELTNLGVQELSLPDPELEQANILTESKQLPHNLV